MLKTQKKKKKKKKKMVGSLDFFNIKETALCTFSSLVVFD